MLRILDKNKNILSGLSRYWDLKVTKKLSLGDKTLEFNALIEDITDVVNEGYVETQDERYVVKEISPGSDGLATVFCQLDVETLEGKTFTKFESVEQTLSAAMSLAFAGTGWTVGTCDITKRRTLRKSNCTALDMVKQALSVYRCECVIHTKSMIIDFVEHTGQDKGTYFVSDLNLKKLEVSQTSYDYYTEIEPYGKEGMTIESVNGGSKYLTNYTYSNKHRRLIWKDERYTVPESLMEDAQAKLDSHALPYRSFKADVIDLATISTEYGILDYDIGDTVTLIDPTTQTRDKQRIVEMVVYPDEPERNSCTFANVSLTFEELAAKFNETAETVDNITTDNGTLDGSKVNDIKVNQISNFNSGVSNSTAIQAVTAQIGTLTANMATFEEATAEHFTATDADIENLSVSLLDADAGRVVVLESEYATIRSLLAGNAAATQADLIQLNAQNAVIDTAFLKNLISSNITVNDLLAGTIYTNKFRVMSPDGAFDLNGKLMQFKDANNVVRIQIGQDGQGNYNYYLANANGEIIWNAAGITANGVPDGLIVDDMVADSDGTYQGISASKLNISSMVGALNQAGGLKSTAIYLDDQAQTLNVAFSQMSQDVQTIGGTASAASSAASQAVATAQNAQETAQNALAVISGISTLDALGASLSNDAHVVHTLTDGTGGVYTDAWTKVTIYLGDTDVSSDTHIEVTKSSGVTGTWNATTRIYQVTNLTTDNGYVDFDCLYGTGERYLVSRQGNRYTLGGNRLMINSGGSHIAKRFSISKAPDGRVGISYDLQVSAVAITRDVEESSVAFTPSAIVARALRNDNGTVSNYSGVFLIEESTDGSTYVQKYRSSSAESQKVYTPSASANLKSIRVTLLDATGAYTYDYQTIAVIADADALKASLTSLAGTVGTVQESVQTNATHISQLETSAQGFSQSISDLETSVRGLSDGNLVVNWRHTDNGDGTATVVCNVYKEGHDIANTFPENWFRYVKRTESGSQLLKIGRTITVNLSDYMFGGTLEGQFMTCEDYYLTTRSGAKLTTRSGKYMTIYKEAA